MTFQATSLEDVKKRSRYPLSRTVSGYEVVVDVRRDNVYHEVESKELRLAGIPGRDKTIYEPEYDDEYHSRAERFASSIKRIERTC